MWHKQDETKPAAVPEREPAPPVASVDRPAPATREPRGEPTRVAQSITVKGDLSGSEDLYFDGTLEGRIHVPDCRVTIGPNGRVQAEIEANEIVVEGQVNGNLRARARVDLCRTSRVRGDVVAGRIAIQEGARLHGHVEVIRGEAAGARAAASAAAESYPAVPVSAAGAHEDPTR